MAVAVTAGVVEEADMVVEAVTVVDRTGVLVAVVVGQIRMAMENGMI
jgi:hypothetical protein